ncbi:hypothetical protein Moror_3306 [Moniliophthora roreri MCA 2997]|uniref:Uncharacterized protein n=1 Tax=Moniliophthora roreri (strain MCA 2997) TaxID=1381753 RepID=V2WNQ5_MONRO|nr:hypothetical protein Moror_3306 [Moniliophthora roreri MCA 2997]
MHHVPIASYSLRQTRPASTYMFKHCCEDFVLIDFAFTRFRLGEAMIAEHFRIRDQFFIEVADSGLSFPVVEEEWFPFDDFES